MRFDIITILPELFTSFLQVGVSGRACQRGRATAALWNPRDYTADRHRTVDDKPFGGGSGMVLKAAPIAAALGAARADNHGEAIYLSPRGELFTDGMARQMAKQTGFILLCGRYRGIDERAVAGLRCLSVGDYILSGGETAAMIIMDAVLRHCPGVLGNADSLAEENLAAGLLDAPTYTRPAVWEGKAAPAALLSGDHMRAQKWRQQAAEKLTQQCRPDLWRKRLSS